MYVQRAPVMTICMLSTFCSNLLFSYLASLLFNKGIIPEKWQVLNIKTPKPSQELVLLTKPDEQAKSEAQNETECMLTANERNLN